MRIIRTSCFWGLVLSAAIAFTCVPYLAAQDESDDPAQEENSGIEQRFRKSQYGEIVLEQEEKKDPYKMNQDQAIGFFQDMDQKVKQAGQGASISGLNPSEGVLHHLTGAYLFCLQKSGICPMVLEALFEVDVINSKLRNEAHCPVLKKFWGLWINSGMEDRSKYSVKLGSFEQVAEFNANVRPKYIECEETVSKEIAGGKPSSEFFRSRYQGQTRPALAASKVASFLTLLKQKVPNVFTATGARSGAASGLRESSAAPKGAKRTRK